MAISFNAVKPPDALQIAVDVIGDGTSTELTIPLDVPPLNLDLKGNLPIGVIRPSWSGGSVTASLGADRKSVTLAFSVPPAAAPNDTTATFILQFAGV